MALSPRKIGEGLYQPLADINVTPLVDVMLVLLIIFMVTAPMLATGIKVNLPSAKTAQPLENKEPVVVAVAKDGSLSVGRDAVSRGELAEARIGRAASPVRSGAPVFPRAAPQARCQRPLPSAVRPAGAPDRRAKARRREARSRRR